MHNNDHKRAFERQSLTPHMAQPQRALTQCSDPDLLDQLHGFRQGRCVPGRLRVVATQVVDLSLGLLFPHFSAGGTVEEDVSALCSAIDEAGRLSGSSCEALGYVRQLPSVRAQLVEDAEATYGGDPAAASLDEVILAYPGFLATAVYRLSHMLLASGAELLPRMLAECAHSRTGIDIHPGAAIGKRFCIDHGTGVVVGETAVIGDDVKLYQGVTLGALTVDKTLARRKRHPTLGNNVVVYANATILGGETIVGDNAIIGGNVWLTRSVPAGAVVTHDPSIRVRAPGEPPPLEFQI